MKRLLCILAALVAVSVSAQIPFQVGGLEWPVLAGCTGSNFAGAQFYVMMENSSLTNFLAGGGSSPSFSITANPANGSAFIFSQSTGSNEYTPNNNYIGADQYQYSVSCGCSTVPAASGVVSLNIMTNNMETCGTWYLTNGSAGNPNIYCPTPISSGFVEFALITGPLTAGGPALFDTNQSWTFTVSDSAGAVQTTEWVYTADSPPTQWCPPVSTDPNPPAVFFNAALVSCPPVGDVVTGSLCPGATCGLGCGNQSNSFNFSISGNYNNSCYSGFTVCNIYSTNRNYVMSGVDSWSVGSSGSSASLWVITNGDASHLVTLASHTGGTGSGGSGTESPSHTFVIGPNSTVTFCPWLNSGIISGTPTFSGAYTNKFQ